MLCYVILRYVTVVVVVVVVVVFWLWMWYLYVIVVVSFLYVITVISVNYFILYYYILYMVISLFYFMYFLYCYIIVVLLYYYSFFAPWEVDIVTDDTSPAPAAAYIPLWDGWRLLPLDGSIGTWVSCRLWDSHSSGNFCSWASRSTIDIAVRYWQISLANLIHLFLTVRFVDSSWSCPVQIC